MNLRHRGGRVILGVLALGLIAIATLPPTGALNSPSGLCIVCGERGGADSFLNLLLFVPLGVAFYLLRLKFSFAVAVAAGLTFVIELAQLTLISGRDASIADLLWNTVGAAVGYGITAQLPMVIKPTQTRSRQLAFAWIAVLAVLPFVFAFALTPSVRGQTYYWQWTPELGAEHEYDGELIAVHVDGRTLSRGSAPSSPQLERAVESGALDFVFVAADPVPARTTLFAIANERGQHLLRVSIKQRDIIVNVRRRARSARFDYPSMRFSNALSRVAADDTVRVHIERSLGRMRLTAMPGGAHEVTTRISHFWTLLYASSDALPREAIINAMLLVSLMLPVGYWSMRGECFFTCVATGFGALMILPVAVGMTRLTNAESATCMIAAAAGALLVKRQLGSKKTGETIGHM